MEKSDSLHDRACGRRESQLPILRFTACDDREKQQHNQADKPLHSYALFCFADYVSVMLGFFVSIDNLFQHNL